MYNVWNKKKFSGFGTAFFRFRIQICILSRFGSGLYFIQADPWLWDKEYVAQKYNYEIWNFLMPHDVKYMYIKCEFKQKKNICRHINGHNSIGFKLKKILQILSMEVMENHISNQYLVSSPFSLRRYSLVVSLVGAIRLHIILG